MFSGGIAIPLMSCYKALLDESASSFENFVFFKTYPRWGRMGQR